MSDLKELLERVEKATGPGDWQLNADLLDALIGVDAADAKRWYGGGWSSDFLRHIGAALDLVERVMPGWHWSLYDTDGLGRKNCQIEPPEYSSEPFDGRGDTAPLAILAALLKAFISQEKHP